MLNPKDWSLALVLAGLIVGCDDATPAVARAPDPQPSAPVIEDASTVSHANTAPTASASAVQAAAKGDDWIERAVAGSAAEKWLGRAAAHRVEILVRVIDPGSPATIAEHAFRVDAEYIYPASAIKTFMAVAVLCRLHALADERGVKLGAGTRFGETSVRAEVEKMLRVSDNEAFAHLYDVVGHREANEILWGLGFASVRIHHRMGGTREEGLAAPRIELLPVEGDAIVLPARKSDLLLPATPAAELSLGRAHMLASKKRIDGPMSFADKNYASLADLQRLQLSLVMPEAPGAVDLGLSAEERELLVAGMSGGAVPEDAHDELAGPHRPLLPGVRRVLPRSRIRYVGRSGRAYGFQLENAFIEDRETHRAMLVTAAMYSDDDGVVNDDLYDYDDATQPFLRALGEALARAVFTR